MKIYFSKSANGFFIEGVHTEIPADKFEVSHDTWQRLIADQSPTSQLSGDPAGSPILINPEDGNKVVYSLT